MPRIKLPSPAASDEEININTGQDTEGHRFKGGVEPADEAVEDEAADDTEGHKKHVR